MAVKLKNPVIFWKFWAKIANSHYKCRKFYCKLKGFLPKLKDFFPKLKNLGNPLAGNKKKWLKNKPELFSRYLLVAKSGFFPTNFWQTRFTGVAETLSFS